MTGSDDASSSSSSLDLPLLVHSPFKGGLTRIDFDSTDDCWWTEARARVEKRGRRVISKVVASSPYDWLSALLPCITWLRVYSVRDWIWSDVAAGLSVAAMVIPQGISYASLAGLPSAYGLYGAFVPALTYAALGSSRQLAVGPVAITSVLLGTSLPEIMDGLGVAVNDHPNHPLDPEAQAVYNQAAVQVAFLAGCMYTSIGLLRLGWLTNFLSPSVISGFTTGASIQIAVSQLKWILGVQVPRANSVLRQVINLVRARGNISLPEVSMGLGFIALLLALRWASGRWRRAVFLRALGPLTVCALSIGIMTTWRLWEPASGGGPDPIIRPVGALVPGLPAMTVGWWLPLLVPSRQLSLAAVVCLVDICESISIARTLAAANGYRLHPTRELLAMGVANLAGSAFNCYTTTGSFSRSAVSNAVGARSPAAGAITGAVLLLVLAFLTPLFNHLSANVQGAIIIVGVLQLFDWRQGAYLARVAPLDAAVWLTAVLTVLFVGVEWGVLSSAALSLLILVARISFPAIQRLGRLPGTNYFRPVRQYKTALPPRGYAVLSIAAPVCFASVEHIREGLREDLTCQMQEASKHGEEPLRFVVLDLSASPTFDSAAIQFITGFVRDLERLEIKLVLANPSKQVLSMIKRAGLVPLLGMQNIQADAMDAILYVEDSLKGNLV